MPPAVENGLSLTEFVEAKHGTQDQQSQAGMCSLSSNRGDALASRCLIADLIINGHSRHFFNVECKTDIPLTERSASYHVQRCSAVNGTKQWGVAGPNYVTTKLSENFSKLHSFSSFPVLSHFPCSHVVM